MAAAADATLDEMRLALAPRIARAAVFDGWGDAALVAAATDAGIDPSVARLAFPGGAIDLIDGWIEAVDAAMQARFDDGSLANMPIRQRITELVWFRLEQVGEYAEALRRALAIQAMPQNVGRALKRGWASADAMWRLAGDSSTDYNYYTKRTILASIYAATLAVFVDDASEDRAETRAFLERRIEGVMRFEKAKARVLGKERDYFDVARFLGRLRYPQK